MADWMNVLRDAQGPDTDRATAARMATLVMATIRGCCSTCSPPVTEIGSRTRQRASSPASSVRRIRRSARAQRRAESPSPATYAIGRDQTKESAFEYSRFLPRPWTFAP